MKFCAHLLLILFPMLNYAQSTEAVELVIQNAKWSDNYGFLSFEVYFINNTNETVELDNIRHHLGCKLGGIPKAKFVGTVGEIEKTYQLKLIKEGKCLSPKPVETKKFSEDLAYHYNAFKSGLLPGQQSKTTKMEVYIGDNYFCEDATFTMQLMYEPKYVPLTTEQENKLLEFHDKYDAITKKSKAYMSQEGLLKNKWKEDRSQMKFLVEHTNHNMKKLTPLKIESAIIEVVKK